MCPVSYSHCHVFSHLHPQPCVRSATSTAMCPVSYSHSHVSGQLQPQPCVRSVNAAVICPVRCRHCHVPGQLDTMYDGSAVAVQSEYSHYMATVARRAGLLRSRWCIRELGGWAPWSMQSPRLGLRLRTCVSQFFGARLHWQGAAAHTHCAWLPAPACRTHLRCLPPVQSSGHTDGSSRCQSW